MRRRMATVPPRNAASSVDMEMMAGWLSVSGQRISVCPWSQQGGGFVGWVERSDTHQYFWCGDGYRCAPPILVIAKSNIIAPFRKEWPAADCNPQQAADDRIVPILSSLWLPRSMIASAPSSVPGWLPEQLGSLYKAGSTKMTQTNMTTAGIDTSKL